MLIAGGVLLGCDGEQASSPPPAETQPSARTDLLVGYWEGTWTSEVDDGSGKLTANIVKLDENRYRSVFVATYGGFIPFKQEVVVTADRSQVPWEFEGSSDLGWMAGGVFRYDGHSDGETFWSTYKSKSEKGVFEMRRISDKPRD
jgi:hypothetical protein